MLHFIKTAYEAIQPVMGGGLGVYLGTLLIKQANAFSQDDPAHATKIRAVAGGLAAIAGACAALAAGTLDVGTAKAAFEGVMTLGGSWLIGELMHRFHKTA